jgi:hypothetical protein
VADVLTREVVSGWRGDAVARHKTVDDSHWRIVQFADSHERLRERVAELERERDGLGAAQAIALHDRAVLTTQLARAREALGEAIAYAEAWAYPPPDDVIPPPNEGEIRAWRAALSAGEGAAPDKEGT